MLAVGHLTLDKLHVFHSQDVTRRSAWRENGRRLGTFKEHLRSGRILPDTRILITLTHITQPVMGKIPSLNASRVKEWTGFEWQTHTHIQTWQVKAGNTRQGFHRWKMTKYFENLKTACFLFTIYCLIPVIILIIKIVWTGNKNPFREKWKQLSLMCSYTFLDTLSLPVKWRQHPKWFSSIWHFLYFN